MMKKIDLIVLAVYVVLLVILFFLWGCGIDAAVTAMGAFFAMLAAAVMYLQYRKLKEND